MCPPATIEDGSISDGAGLRLVIDLDALVRNWRRLARLAVPAECAAVVKADAYGLGIDKAVAALTRAGCRTFFVALPHEGVRARAAAPDAVIYVLNSFFEQVRDHYAAHRLRPVLGSREEIEAFLAWPGREQAALHVDTGMNRLGLRVEDYAALDPAMIENAGISLLMSHLACADEPDSPLNAMQLERFRALPAPFAWRRSLANSAGLHLGPEYRFDLARPGISLYGGASHPAANPEPVVAAQARILQVRVARAGETVGYGAAKRLTRDSRIAILSAGYADGYPRAAGGPDGKAGASVSIGGRAAPILGRVSMDLIAADVTDLPERGAARGLIAELFGHHIGIDAVAESAGTIAYELLTGLSRRAARVYLGVEEDR